MTNPRPFVAGANNTTYSLVSGWNGFIWSVPYNNVMNNVSAISELTATDFPTLNGVNLILKVSAMHRVSDVFGPIVYTNFGDLTKAGVYDSQETAYKAFFADLDTAVANLMANIDNINKGKVTTKPKRPNIISNNLFKFVTFFFKY